MQQITSFYFKLKFSVENFTRNVTCCNNDDDLLHLNFTIFQDLYINQPSIYYGAFIAKIVSR